MPNQKPSGESHVLIVEDDSISQFVLQKMLGNDFEVTLAKNSEEVFDILAYQRFSIILMDINLGEDSMNGKEIMQTIKSNLEYGSPWIFAVTSYALPEDEKAFLEEGFDDYLAKPVKKEELMAAIKNRLA